MISEPVPACGDPGAICASHGAVAQACRSRGRPPSLSLAIARAGHALRLHRCGGSFRRRSADAAPSPAQAAAAATTAAAAPAAANNDSHLHIAAKVFVIEEMERGETDVRHFLFTQHEALIGRDT